MFLITSMKNMNINNIKSIIELKTKDIPQVYEEFEQRINTGESAIMALISALKRGEEIIEEEHKKKYITNDYENDLIGFTKDIISYIISNKYYIKHKKNEGYKELLCQKHMAYSYYHYINEHSQNMTENERWFNVDKNIQKDMYIGMAKFYSSFNGRFSDNQEAIELLCKFFPQYGSDFGKYEMEIISCALYSNIRYAGTPNDLGYAFQGIGLIEKYVNLLPEYIIKTVLKFYTLNQIITQNVYRHQVVSIIMNSCLEENIKRKMKFWCIDAVLIGEYFEQKFINTAKQECEKIEISLQNIVIGIADDREVLSKPEAYWKNIEWEKRILYVNKERIGELSLENIIYNNKLYHIPFDEYDWQINLDFKKLLFDEEKNQILFSLLYLNNYRGLCNKVIDFDHNFEYGINGKDIKKKEKKSLGHFYGENVYSLTCIVGKNGTGKTSIVDFLREAFFGMLYIIKEKGCSKPGYISEEDYSSYEILDKNSEFLVVFHFNGNIYYLSNIQNINAEGVTPLENNDIINIGDMGKIAYFSNMLRSDQMGLYSYDLYSKETNILKNINLIDFSETKSFIVRHSQMQEDMNKETDNNKKYVNRDFLLQLLLLHNLELDKLEKLFDFNASKEFYIEGDTERLPYSILQIKNVEILNNIINKYITNPKACLKNFSSGQYFKFMLFSRLYYFLYEGKEKLKNSFFSQYTEFLQSDCMGNNDVAIIFIDEGEVYYHPEWQRRYIDDLLSFINNGDDKKVQIILTTNSPFILSDILGDDITYLSGGIIKKTKTLGQNIHMLLTDNFFLEATIGEYAKQFIKDIATYITNSKKKDILKKYTNDEEIDIDKLKNLIELIGEQIYKTNLEMLLSESRFYNKKQIYIEDKLD